MRGNGFRPYNTPTVDGTRLEHMTPSTDVLAFGQLVCQGSTMGGTLGVVGTTMLTKQKFICFRATTGATDTVPFLRVGLLQELVAPVATSETVISTTQIGQQIAYSSSGTCLCPATTGHFVISGVFNTSAVTGQFLTGHFIPFVGTTA